MSNNGNNRGKSSASSRELASNLTINLLRECELDEPSEVLSPGPSGRSFAPGVPRFMARMLQLLGWNQPATFFLPTNKTLPFLFNDYAITVPRAPVQGQVGEVRISFAARPNETVMFKELEVNPQNPTASTLSRILFAEGRRNRDNPVGRLEERIRVARELGRTVIPWSSIRENDGSLIIILQNTDPFSEAMFCIRIEGWVVLS